jgi:inosine-uridine nucleoside N-ribohydrolase
MDRAASNAGLNQEVNGSMRPTYYASHRRCSILGFGLLLLSVTCMTVQPVLAAGLSSMPSPNPPSTQVPNVIFDTDIWADIDDMLALAMLHALQDRNEVRLVAVTISTDNENCASYVDLVDTFYGHSQIPIGIVHGGVTTEEIAEKHPGLSFPAGYYPKVISERRKSDGSFFYPRRIVGRSTAVEAVQLLRKSLAAQPDASVIVIEVGFSTNLARLLNSKSDSISPLSGRDLVTKKVKMLSMMAGSFGDVELDGESYPKGGPEFNLLMDIESAQEVLANWPTPVVLSGTEVGTAISYAALSIERDYSYVTHHPIADSYRVFHLHWIAADGHVAIDWKWPHDHHTADLTSVLFAARPDRGYFSVSPPGKVTVLANGGSRFEETEGGLHRYLILDAAQRARTLEAMEMLASQPPRKSGE